MAIVIIVVDNLMRASDSAAGSELSGSELSLYKVPAKYILVANRKTHATDSAQFGAQRKLGSPTIIAIQRT